MISFLDAIQCFPFHLFFAQGQPYMPPVPVASPGTSDNEDFFKEAVECRERFALISSDCKKKIIEFQHPKDLRWY